MHRLLLFLMLATPASAQTPILLALRANDWPLAQTLAQADPDPLAPKLVTFIRLLNPGQATAAELAAFMADNPAWPDRPALERRYGEALADDADLREAAGLCRMHKPQPDALAQCAIALAQQADRPAAERDARAAWTGGLNTPEQEADFLARWPGLPTPADQKARFDWLARTDPAAAARQVSRLDPPLRALATALLALRHDDPAGLARLADVPAEHRADAALLLAEARFLRRSHATAAATALWRTALPQAEAAASAAARGPFWTERDALARDVLAQGDAPGAFALADDTLLPPDQAGDQRFLAGWIALRALHDPARARAEFTALAGLSHAAITQARALYWLARAAPDPATAHALYLRAAEWPLTYYGQLAARAAGLDEAALRAAILARHDPTPSSAEQAAFARGEMARAATILAGWQDRRRGADFLLQVVQPPASPEMRALAAQLALKLGVPDVAVQAARLAGRDGTVLPQSGWPAPFMPPSPPAPALSLAIMRQESSFDPGIVSAAGAHGLMQVMQATAGQLGRTLHVASGPLSDPDVNMRLGTAYLKQLLDQFAPCLPCAIAAYNAGPHRVQAWLAVNRQPTSADAAVDWVEAIPFAETRNYVQRVMENEVDYGARGR